MRKKWFLLIQLISLTQLILCQDVILYSSNNLMLKIHLKETKFRIWEKPKFDLVDYDILSEGKIMLDKNLIICVDSIKNEKIIFQHIDSFRLIVVNENRYLKVKELICPITIYNNLGNPIQWMSWKNGKRHGEWNYQTDKGYKFEIYENGQIVKTYFKTYEEIKDEISKMPAKL